jgi:Signal transduction histidine kinase regulating citrate/malate metabolism
MLAATLGNILVFYCFLRPRFKWWLYPLMIAITYFALPMIYNLNNNLFDESMPNNLLMACLGYWGEIMVLIFFREHFWRLITFLFTTQILNRLFTFIGYLLQIPLNTIFGCNIDVQLSITLVIVIMYVVISLVCWLALRKKGQELIQAESHHHYWVILASIAVSAKLIIDFCTDYVFSMNPYSDSKLIIAMIALSAFVLAVLALYLYSTLITTQHVELKASTDRLAFEKEALQRYYETQLLNQEELRRMKHDMNGNLSTIYRLLLEKNYDEATRYLAELSNYAESHQRIRYCEDPYLNAVVINYAKAFEANHTLFEQDIQLGNFELHHVEMCLILNNSLQNALEASLKLLPEQRYVKLQIKTKQRRLLIRITNHFYSDLIFDGEIPRSTKEGKGHGYGLTSIRNAVESVGGFAVCKIEDDMFVLDVAT